jgi:hypothetical protein
MVEDMFEVSMRWPGRSYGTAGGAHSQLNRVAQQLNERSSETLGFETRAERDLMLVLHRPIEPTANSGHSRILRQSAYNVSPDSVLQSAMLPELNPAKNQRLRCADVPWVKASGTT